MVQKVHLYNVNEAVGGGMNGGSFNEMQAKNVPVNMSLVEGNFWSVHKKEFLYCMPIPFSCNDSIDLEGVGAKLASSRLPWYSFKYLAITHGAAASPTKLVMVLEPQLVPSKKDAAHLAAAMM